jgi:hypothetical protein
MEHDAEGMLMEYEMEPNRMLLNVCESNIARNKAETEGTDFDVQELEWGDENRKHIERILKSAEYDVIIGSDVTYHANLSHALFWTVSQLLQRQERSNALAGKAAATVTFLAAHQHRLDSATALTLSTAREFGLQCTTLATSRSIRNKSHAANSASSVNSIATEVRAGGPGNNSEGTEERLSAQYRYSNAEGVEDDFALWQFTLQQ